ncbi:NYN domain-containing protein [cf. Phormidesmis sp. LEGE 11477]|nr:NYN domain-containing protein [cf. Phormidesmis sp. LEGE 11477]
MKKADEHDSRDPSQSKASDREASVTDHPLASAEAANTEVQATIRRTRSRTKLSTKPKSTSKLSSPVLSTNLPSDSPSKKNSTSDSSPEPPKTASKRKERDATANSLKPGSKSDRKTIKTQPSPPANSWPVTQSSDLITIFIDGSNLFYAASHLNIEVDYRRLLTSLVRGRRLLRAYFYTGVDPQNEKQRGFLLWLNRHGHRVVSKELTNLPDGSRKANMHVEMAVDMMRIAEYCPNITLLGGDGNLAYALQVLSQRGTFIEVVSLQSMTSDSLIDLADSYTDLADLRDAIKR